MTDGINGQPAECIRATAIGLARPRSNGPFSTQTFIQAAIDLLSGRSRPGSPWILGTGRYTRSQRAWRRSQGKFKWEIETT